MTHAFNTRINRSVNRFRHLLCSLFRDKRDSAGAIFALTLYTFERSSKRINLTYACSIQYIINNPDASVGVCCSHKVVAVGFNTLCYDAERCRGRRVLNPPHESSVKRKPLLRPVPYIDKAYTIFRYYERGAALNARDSAENGK